MKQDSIDEYVQNCRKQTQKLYKKISIVGALKPPTSRMLLNEVNSNFHERFNVKNPLKNNGGKNENSKKGTVRNHLGYLKVKTDLLNILILEMT